MANQTKSTQKQPKWVWDYAVRRAKLELDCPANYAEKRAEFEQAGVDSTAVVADRDEIGITIRVVEWCDGRRTGMWRVWMGWQELSDSRRVVVSKTGALNCLYAARDRANDLSTGIDGDETDKELGQIMAELNGVIDWLAADPSEGVAQ